MTILLRIGRRRTSWESADVVTIVETEFRRRDGEIDLRPSVYEVADELPTIVRTHAEHCAAAGMHPPRDGCRHVNLAIDGQMVRESPGNDYFEHTNSCHRELVFESEGAMCTFLSEIVKDASTRRRRTHGSDIRSYAKECLAQEDPEWVRFCASHPMGGHWECFRDPR